MSSTDYDRARNGDSPVDDESRTAGTRTEGPRTTPETRTPETRTPETRTEGSGTAETRMTDTRTTETRMAGTRSGAPNPPNPRAFDAEESGGGGGTGGSPGLSRPAGLFVALVAAVCVTTALAHMCMVFLFVAPPNTVSQRYQRQIDSWIYPYFEQNWQLFAPDPQSVNQWISARAETTSPDGSRHAGGWIDLTAADVTAVRHSLFPSHTAQNMLRRAWAAYTDAQGNADESDSQRGRMLRDYLRNIAAQRLAAHGNRAFDAVQLRVVTTPIPPEQRAAGSPASGASSSTRYLPWWQVTSHEH